MNRIEKSEWRESVVRALDSSTSIFLANYSGMTVEELSSLRRELRAVRADFQVVKNTIARRALEGRSEAVVSKLLKGQMGVVFAYGDVGAAAKTLSNAAKKYEKLTVVAGSLEGSLIDQAGITKIADLPSREVLIAKILGAMVAPHRGLLNALNGVSR